MMKVLPRQHDGKLPVELCRAMKWINVSESVLQGELLILLKEGLDWGAREAAQL
jgi:hypothetical protein